MIKIPTMNASKTSAYFSQTFPISLSAFYRLLISFCLPTLVQVDNYFSQLLLFLAEKPPPDNR